MFRFLNFMYSSSGGTWKQINGIMIRCMYKYVMMNTAHINESSSACTNVMMNTAYMNENSSACTNMS